MKAKLLEIQRVKKIINNPNRIVFVDIILKLLAKQRDLSPIHTLDKPCHPIPPARIITGIITRLIFSHRLGPLRT